MTLDQNNYMMPAPYIHTTTTKCWYSENSQVHMQSKYYEKPSQWENRLHEKISMHVWQKKFNAMKVMANGY